MPTVAPRETKRESKSMSKNFFVELEDRAQRSKAATLVASTAIKMSVAEFLDTSARLASWIAEVHPEPNGVIALNVQPELEAMLVFACYRQGLITCHYPVNKETLRSIGCTLIITSNHELDSGSIPKLNFNDAVLSKLASLDQVEPFMSEDPNRVVNLFFSSGTTGSPKVVPVTAAEMQTREAFVRSARIRGKYMSLLGLGTFGGFMTMFSQLMNLETFFTPTTAESNAKLISNWAIDTVFGSPQQLSELADQIAKVAPNLQLREIQGTGLPVPRALAARLISQTGSVITNAYGSTEAGVVAMKTGSEDQTEYAGEILDGVTLQVVDTQGFELPGGEVGIVRIKSPGQATQYWNNPEATREQFVDGWFYPGDLGSRISNSLFLAGRNNDVLNAGGVKVDPTKLEDYLRSKEDIDDAAVFVFDAPGGVKSAAAAIVSSRPIDGESLRSELRGQFGEASPSYFLRLGKIPRTELGKIARSELSRILETRLQ